MLDGWALEARMIDPVFGDIRFSVDAWDGRVPFLFLPGGTAQFAVHVWSDRNGPTAGQQATFKEFCSKYAVLWPAIARALADCHPASLTVEQVGCSLKPTVACHIERGSSGLHNDFELVYEFNLDGEDSRAFFVRISGWQIVETVMAV
jgi:hypothetical protein